MLLMLMMLDGAALGDVQGTSTRTTQADTSDNGSVSQEVLVAVNRKQCQPRTP